MKLKSTILAPAVLAAALSLSPAFAADTPSSPPKGWYMTGTAPQQFIFGTEKCAKSKCAFIKARNDSPSGFGTLMQMVGADRYLGKRLQLSAMLKTAGADHAQLWMRMDGPKSEMLGFYNMDDRPVTGTTDWKRYSVVLDVPDGTKAIAFGVFLNGKGALWIQDFKLDLVGKDVPVSISELPKTPVNLDFSH